MATRVGLAKIRMTPFDWLPPKNPQFGAKNVGPMLNLTRFIVNFV